jgi:hypothetical protein
MKIEKRMEFISALIEENCLSCGSFRSPTKSTICLCEKILTPIKEGSESDNETKMLVEEWSKQQREILEN